MSHSLRAHMNGSLAVRRTFGFTLLELMVTIAIAAILAVIGVPSFREYILNQRIKNASYDLISALTLARSEAITRNTSARLIATGGSWNGGWCVTTTDCTTPLLTHEAFNPGIDIDAVLAGTSTAGPTTITYGLNGRTSSASTVFAITPATELNGVKTRYVTICLSGLPRGTTDDSGGC